MLSLKQFEANNVPKVGFSLPSTLKLKKEI